MNTSPTIRNFEDFRDAIFAFRLPRILLTALELKLFTVMGKRAWKVKTLAKTLKASERGTAILCRNLASAGLLRKTGTAYRSRRFAQTFLDEHSKQYRGQYLALVQRQWDDWAKLTHAVKVGKPLDSKEPETPAYRRSFSWAMHQRSMDSARHVAQQVDLSNANSLLDVGGGPGTYAMEFLKRNPRLRATIVDRPTALQVAKQIAKPLRYGKRLSYHPADFLTDTITGTYDVIWVSNVIHIYSLSINTKLFRKLRSCLNPGGQILIQDTFLLDKEGLRPVETNLFAVTMLLFTETGNTYKASEVQEALRKSGWRRPGVLRLQQGTGDWEGILIQAFGS